MQNKKNSNFSPKARAISYLEMVDSLLSENLDLTQGKIVSDKLKEVVELIGSDSKMIELINCEGPVLRLKKLGKNSFEIIDQWGKVVNQITRADVLAFISGEVSIKDSSGASYSYPDYSIGAKPSNSSVIDSFLYDR